VSGPTVEIGPYVVGEIPPPLEYTFNLTGFTVRFQRAEIQGTFISPVTSSASLSDAVNGKVTFTWTATDFTQHGRYGGMFWAGNGVNRYASWLITWTTCASIDVPPSI
jgi:hypothetical protein